MSRSRQAFHTVGAAIVTIIVFFALLYLASPVFEWAINLFGRLFVPERFGGGAALDHPGLITRAVRALLLSGVSAFLAFTAAFDILSDAKSGLVAIGFSVAVAAWGTVMAILVPTQSAWEAILVGYVPILLVVVPALGLSYVMWQEHRN